jgi:hypothetical protein
MIDGCYLYLVGSNVIKMAVAHVCVCAQFYRTVQFEDILLFEGYHSHNYRSNNKIRIFVVFKRDLTTFNKVGFIRKGEGITLNQRRPHEQPKIKQLHNRLEVHHVLQALRYIDAFVPLFQQATKFLWSEALVDLESFFQQRFKFDYFKFFVKKIRRFLSR